MLLEDGEARRRRNKPELIDARPLNAAKDEGDETRELAKILPVTLHLNEKTHSQWKIIGFLFFYILYIFIYITADRASEE